jgi:hypothetical protein
MSPDRAADPGLGPQTVPAWMIVVAWHHPRQMGELSQNELLNDLNVKARRSSVHCWRSFLMLLFGRLGRRSWSLFRAMTADRRHAQDGGKLMSNRSVCL